MRASETKASRRREKERHPSPARPRRLGPSRAPRGRARRKARGRRNRPASACAEPRGRTAYRASAGAPNGAACAPGASSPPDGGAGGDNDRRNAPSPEGRRSVGETRARIDAGPGRPPKPDPPERCIPKLVVPPLQVFPKLGTLASSVPETRRPRRGVPETRRPRRQCSRNSAGPVTVFPKLGSPPLEVFPKRKRRPRSLRRAADGSSPRSAPDEVRAHGRNGSL
jgi:hypothetical protein